MNVLLRDCGHAPWSNPTDGRASSRRPVIGFAVAATLTVAATAGAVWKARDHVSPPRPPVLSYTQDAAGIHINIHNVNADWGLRDQEVILVLRGDEGNIVTHHGGQLDRERGSTCCAITLLRPHRDYTFDVPPTKAHIAGLSVDLLGGRQWVRM